jgi:Zn-dependent protease
VPVPPLDGSRVMAWLLPEGLRESYVRLERFGMYIVFGLLFLVPGFSVLLQRSVFAILTWIDRMIPIGTT